MLIITKCSFHVKTLIITISLQKIAFNEVYNILIFTLKFNFPYHYCFNGTFLSSSSAFCYNGFMFYSLNSYIYFFSFFISSSWCTSLFYLLLRWYLFYIVIILLLYRKMNFQLFTVFINWKIISNDNYSVYYYKANHKRVVCLYY